MELGLRWDKWTVYHEKQNRLVNVDLNTSANIFQVITPDSARMEDLPGVPPSVLASWAVRGLTWKTANQVGFPSSLLPADNNNFGPRLGAAFKLTDKWVLRGGYGEYFWTMPLAQLGGRANPPLNLLFVNQIATDPETGSETYALRTAPSPEFYIGTASVNTQGIVFIPPGGQDMAPWDARNWKDSHAHSWHFTVEREILPQTALRLTCVGNYGRDMEQVFSVNNRESEYNYVARTGQAPPSFRDLLRINPNWNFFATNHTGYSNTHSVQAEVERKYANGLAFQWFYSFTRSLTTSDWGGSSVGSGPFSDTGSAPKVPENINIIGEPNLSYDQRLRLVYYNSTAVPAERIRFNGIYDLPFGHGRHFGAKSSGFLNLVVGGWQIAAIGDWRSGLWSGIDPRLYMMGDPTLNAHQRVEMNIFGRQQRLWFRGFFDPTQATNVTGGDLLALVPADPLQRIAAPLGPNFDNKVPQRLADGTVRMTLLVDPSVDSSLGDTLSPNAKAFFRGPGAWRTDISLSKNFNATERLKVRFSADFFNAFNHPNDVAPDTFTGLQDLSRQTNDPRIIQFSLRLDW